MSFDAKQILLHCGIQKADMILPHGFTGKV